CVDIFITTSEGASIRISIESVTSCRSVDHDTSRRFPYVVNLLASCGSNKVIIDNTRRHFNNQSNLLPKDVSNFRYRLSGVTADPKARSVLEQLRSCIFAKDSPWQPKIFVTDQEHALMNGINKVYPGASTILCYIHMMRNFENKLGGLFLDKKRWGETQNVLYAIIHSQDMDQYNMW
ncbi:hypothetical protein, partial, partial [Absidia glauca]